MIWRCLYQALPGLGSGAITLTVGFMVERLLLESWEWWMWGIASLPFVALTTFSAWRLHKMDVSEAKLVAKLADRQAGNMEMLRRAIAEPDERKRAIILGAVVEIEGRAATTISSDTPTLTIDEPGAGNANESKE